MILKRFIRSSLILLIKLPLKFYRFFISPIYGANCRFVPSCSEYADEALKKHGIYRAFLLIIRRLSRCHPWGGSGLDQVPQAMRRKDG